MESFVISRTQQPVPTNGGRHLGVKRVCRRAAAIGILIAATASVVPASSASGANGNDAAVSGVSIPQGMHLSEKTAAFLRTLPEGQRQAFVMDRLPYKTGSKVEAPQKMTASEVATGKLKGTVAPNVVAADTCYARKYSFWHTSPAGNRITEMGFQLTSCFTSGGTAKGVTMQSTWGYGNWGWRYDRELDRDLAVVYNQGRGARQIQFLYGGADSGPDVDVLCGMGVLKWGGSGNAYPDTCTVN